MNLGPWASLSFVAIFWSTLVHSSRYGKTLLARLLSVRGCGDFGRLLQPQTYKARTKMISRENASLIRGLISGVHHAGDHNVLRYLEALRVSRPGLLFLSNCTDTRPLRALGTEDDMPLQALTTISPCVNSSLLPWNSGQMVPRLVRVYSRRSLSVSTCPSMS